ncbi:MAG: hypothetical protein E4H09_03390, partial [Spirochaetales bacterium]
MANHNDYYLAICLNPTIQNTLVFDHVELGQVNRILRHRTDIAGKGVNTARVLTQLGERAVHLTQGGGRHLELFRDFVAADGLYVRVV